MQKTFFLTIFIVIIVIILFGLSCVPERQNWGETVNGLRCRLVAGQNKDEQNNVTNLILEIQNTGTNIARFQGQIVEGRSNDGQPVRGVISLTIYGVDKEGNFLYRLRLPDVSNKYFARWSEIVIEPGKSYVQVISLRHTPIIEVSRNVFVGDGKLSQGRHRLIAIVFGGKRSLRSLPLVLTVN